MPVCKSTGRTYNTTKKFSHLKLEDVDTLIKTVCSPDKELKDRIRNSRVSVTHSTKGIGLTLLHVVPQV